MEKIYLKDIAGYDDEKNEAKKIINILKNHKEYEKLGAYIPKGLILSGNPGVGKTMIAKAIANESGVPLFEFESDECENEDDTIKSIKELFKKAKEVAPSIIFIDELDELVSTRDFASDYSRKISKILLTEIDGIESSSGLIVIATTNLRNSLPPSLLRSGRMDKRMAMPMPDLNSREEIIKLYLTKVNLEKKIDAKTLATKTANFSGADIKTLINETVLNCVSQGIKEPSLNDFEMEIPIILFQDIRKTKHNPPSDIVCYHEIGHFIAKYKLDNEIGSISTDRFGQIDGYTSFNDKNKEDPITKNTINKNLIIILSGMAGEEVYWHDISAGALHDIKRAQRAIQMLINVGAYGFDLIQNSSIEKRSDFIFENNDSKKISEKKITNGEQMEAKLLNDAYLNAKKILKENEKLAKKIYQELKIKERLSNKELESIINEDM